MLNPRPGNHNQHNRLTKSQRRRRPPRVHQWSISSQRQRGASEHGPSDASTYASGLGETHTHNSHDRVMQQRHAHHVTRLMTYTHTHTHSDSHDRAMPRRHACHTTTHVLDPVARLRPVMRRGETGSVQHCATPQHRHVISEVLGPVARLRPKMRRGRTGSVQHIHTPTCMTTKEHTRHVTAYTHMRRTLRKT